MAVALRAEELRVTFMTPQGEPLDALGPVSVDIAPGAFVSIVGPSGCGKSTLIRVFAGLQSASAGGAWVDTTPIKRPSPEIGLMFQEATLMPWRTILENIALPLEIEGVKKTDRQQRAADLLKMLDLQDFAESYPREISGGMAQRAALGRVLVQHPGALLLDEPFGALDALTRERISLDLLRIWAKERQTVLMVTHDIQEAVLLSDRVLVMTQRPGKLLADFHIDLPRPRTTEMLYDVGFMAYAKEIRQAIDNA